LSIERAWQNAGLSPATATYIEGHGTSTRVGDVVEVQSIAEVLSSSLVRTGSIALGSVKSNIGHLKSAASAAGFLKTIFALRDKVLPPSLHCELRNPDIDFAHSPCYVNTELTPWTATVDGVRRAGVSAFGFGGTNFHAVLEEYIPHRLTGNGKRSAAISERPAPDADHTKSGKTPLRGALVIGAATETALADPLRAINKDAEAGRAPTPTVPAESDLRAPERLAIDYADAADLADKSAKALKAIAASQPATWKALRAQGIFRGHGPAPKVAFLYTGQGSQYVNMLQTLRAAEPIVAETFAEADREMTRLLDKRLSDYIFVDPADNGAIANAEANLRQTAITQPAVLATDIALTRLLAAYGIQPDMTMGHSLGEYGALVAAGALPFADALEAVSARGREMTRVSLKDNGRMAAIFAPLHEIERLLKTVDNYVVIANINSNSQAVIGGASQAVEQAMQVFLNAGYNAVPLEVSHAFHSSIVAPASEPLRRVLERLRVEPPRLPIVANVTGDFYPGGADAKPQVLDLLARQIAAPVQFVSGLRTLYDAGVRVFVEVGPKKALQGFAEDVLGDGGDVLTLFTNHPKVGDVVSFNQALCGLYAAGLGYGKNRDDRLLTRNGQARAAQPNESVAEFLPSWSDDGQGRLPAVITGAALGLPGTEHIFDDANIGRILRGEQCIDVIPFRLRRAILDKHITRLVKSDSGGPVFETITELADVIKLAGRGGAFDIEQEFGVPAERVAALDRVTRLAIAAGIDALRDAGIPLVMRYKTTSKGTKLPDRWALPEAMRDDTGVIFASAFPGYDSLVQDLSGYYTDRARREQLSVLEGLRPQVAASNGHSSLLKEIEDRIAELRTALDKEPYVFDRRFLFRALSMGHSQLAEFIGARGPNTQINAACASTAQAVALAEDWIRAGRCRRVIVVSADDVTSDHLMEWFGAGFLATGAAATDEVVEDAAIPFDRRRHGMIVGMGAAALVVESADAARERGIRPICELLAAVTANSAFHGTRLDVEHIRQVMENLVTQAESRCGIRRHEAAERMVFVSHETYTPARGGSASAEIHALRRVFGDAADQIVIANTKGFTGHAMATGIEEVVAVKALETEWVPPVANFKEIDPELGPLNLSKGGIYPVEYALRLGAGFGSQISMTLFRWVKSKDGMRPGPSGLGYAYRIENPAVWKAWLNRMAGYPAGDLEVVRRTLRIPDRAVPGPVTETIRTAEPEPPAKVDLATKVERAAKVELAIEAAKPVADDPVKERIVALVAEKTGYPVDMLDLDLDLEADLGVDTVKQAEVFAAVREAYGIGRDDQLRLRDFPTLTHVIRFVHDRLPRAIEPAVLAPAPAQPAGDSIEEKILEIVAEKTGYPKDMLDLDLDLEADLGIDTVKQAEMFAAVRAAFSIPRDENLKLRDFPTLAHVIKFASERSLDSSDRSAEKAPVPAIAKQTTAGDHINEKILEIVAEKTGYPKDMLDLDLDLEADLGIDTVKQAEMFAAVRAAFNIPRDENLKLRDFPTLAHVITFARDRHTTAAAPSAPTPALPAIAAPRPSLAGFEAAERIPRRVPLPTLRPALDICKPTGVKLEPGRRVVVMLDTGGAGAALAHKLQASGVETLLVDGAPDADTFVNRINGWLATGPVHGVYWLPALDNEGSIGKMDLPAWREALRVRVKLLYIAMRSLYEQVAAPGTFLVSATRLGGHHGYDDAGAVAPMGGAVAGFTKTYKRERPEALVKSVDFEAQTEASEVAGLLIAETLCDHGAVEIGYKNGLRWTIGLEEQPVADGCPGQVINKDTVFLITGAAGSIVSAITADLAAASGGTFYLLDLVPEPDPDNPDLKRFSSDKEGLKRDLFARIQARGERATPALVEKELASLERAAAALSAIHAVRAAGGTAHYFSVDLTDSAAVANVIEQVRQRNGRIDVLLHAAGIERSHFLPDKDPREFNLVFDVKSDGWFNLLHAIGDMPLKSTVAFSSVAGRFGNAGQADYSAANDLLCKITSSFRTTRPTTRGIAIDWTAWGGIGMATRGSIPKMMELAGIDMLPPEAGIPWIRRELTAGSRSGEIVVGERLGVLLSEGDVSGGLDLTAVEGSRAQGPMIGKLAVASLYRGLTVETMLDPTIQPFLHDHQIDSTPVLPGVMGIEAFAEAALLMLPGWHIDTIEDITFIAPFKFYRNEPRTLTIHSAFRRDGDTVIADCRLIGQRSLPNQAEPQPTTHFTGRVRLTKHAPKMRASRMPDSPPASIITPADIYWLYFHGPAYQVIRRAWWDGDRMIGEFAGGLPPNHLPSDKPSVIAPRLIELCLQTAGLFEIGTHARMGLPQYIRQLRVGCPQGEMDGPLYAVVTAGSDHESFNAELVDQAGNCYLCLTGYRTVALPNTVDAERFKPLQALMA
jgi:malonyl CoA-acyl carrier protein transacylase